MLLLLELLHEDGLFFVLTALVLEPDPDDPGAQAGHLHELLFHERVWPRVCVVARPQRVQLLLVQHRPDARGFLRLLVHVVPMRSLPHRYWVCCGSTKETKTLTINVF